MRDDKKNFYSAVAILVLIVIAALFLVFFPPESARRFWHKEQKNNVAQPADSTPAAIDQDFAGSLDSKLDKCAQARAKENNSAAFSLDLARFSCLRDLLVDDLDIKSDICSQDKYFSDGDFYGKGLCYASLSKNTGASWENNCSAYAKDMEKKGMDGGSADSFDRCAFLYLSYQPQSISDDLCKKMKTKRGQDNCSVLSKKYNEIKGRGMGEKLEQEITDCLGKGTLTDKSSCAQEVLVRSDNPMVCIEGEKVFGIKISDCFKFRNEARRDVACLSRGIQDLFNCVGN